MKGNPIPVGNDSLVDAAQTTEIALAVPWQNHFVDPGQHFEKQFFHSF
jgi:hypothetical protein